MTDIMLGRDTASVISETGYSLGKRPFYHDIVMITIGNMTSISRKKKPENSRDELT